MQMIHSMMGIPSVYPQFMTDDFGDEVMAVIVPFESKTSFQIKIDPRTYWHLEALNKKIIDWESGHREE